MLRKALMPKRYRIEYDRGACIGAASCTQVHPEEWVLAQDVKADLVGGVQEAASGRWVKEIGEAELEDSLRAAKSCPVNVIRIKDLQTGEYLV